jgi:hypothetical protein
MRLRWTRAILGVLACFLVSGIVLAVDVPLRDWEVRHQGTVMHSPGGVGKAGLDISFGIAFVATEPCRVVDTRPGQGFPAAWGAPILTNGVTRNFDLNSAPHCAGIPAGVGAYSVNFTIAEPVGPGDLRAYPQGSPPATPTSVMNWSGSGAAFAIANAGIVPAGTGGGITVLVAGTNAHLIIDINGYFTDEYNTNNFFSVTGVYDFSGGIGFFNNLTTLAGYAINARTSGTSDGVTAILGLATGSTGRTHGVYGLTNSSSNDSAGVLGIDGSGSPTGTLTTFPAGVRGESTDDRAILGHQADTAGAQTLLTRRISAAGGETIFAGMTCSNTVSACGNGGTNYSGTKSFVEPHPTDASKTIKYISLEGPEAGTYFRGRGRFQRGLATISVPEDFRMVTADEGLSIQVTPIGDMATVAVMHIGLDRIVVKGSRNVEFFYTVNGVRRAFAKHEPIAEDNFFVPESPDFVMSLVYSPDHKARLIANGTYNADGTPNMETAKRLGWDKQWEKAKTRRLDRPKDTNSSNN